MNLEEWAKRQPKDFIDRGRPWELDVSERVKRLKKRLIKWLPDWRDDGES